MYQQKAALNMISGTPPRVQKFTEERELCSNKNFKPNTWGGTHFTWPIASIAACRNPSTDANHCSVALNIVGFFVRQSYGYLCSKSEKKMIKDPWWK